MLTIVGFYFKSVWSSFESKLISGAAESKKMSLCKLIIENVKDKNWVDNNGITPFMVNPSDEYKKILDDLGFSPQEKESILLLQSVLFSIYFS